MDRSLTTIAFVFICCIFWNSFVRCSVQCAAGLS